MKIKLISTILTVVIVGNFFNIVLMPRPAQAISIKSTAVEFSGCATGNLAAQAWSKSELKKRIDDNIKKQIARAEEFLKAHLGPILGKVFGKVGGKAGETAVGIIGGANVPVSDEGTQDILKNYYAAWNDKYTRSDIISRCLARAIMNGISGNITNIARTSGRDGGPTFIKNWNNFETKAQYRGENIFRAELSTAKLCEYLSDDVKKSFGVDPKKKTAITGQNTRVDSLQSFGLKTNCTLPAGFTQEKYQQDFAANGGWDAFVRLQEPQNNAWGLSALSHDEILKQRALAVSADKNQAIANNGQLGVSGRGKNDSCLVKGPAGDCIIYKDIKTPGSYIAANLQASVVAEYQWLTSAQGIGTIVANSTEVLLNRLLDFGNSDEGKYRWADETVPNISPPPDAPEEGAQFDPPTDSLTRHPNQAAMVAAAKESLKQSGADLLGPCGAFKIVATAALAIGNGAGLLSKPDGNNCQGYSVDIIAYQDGYIYDVLGSSGDPEPSGNQPAWNPVGCGTLDCSDMISRYRPAISP